MSERLEFSAVFLRDMALASDHRRPEHGRHKPAFASFVREVGFDQSPHTADHHLVASSEDDRSIISMRFNLCRKTCGTEISGEKRVIHSFGAIRQFFARSGV